MLLSNPTLSIIYLIWVQLDRRRRTWLGKMSFLILAPSELAQVF
jgi:hypothetical protein